MLVGTAAAIVAATLFGMLGPLSRFGAEAGVEGVAFTAWRAILGVSFLAILIAARGTLRPSVAAVRGLSRAGRLSLATAAVMGVALNVAMFTAFGLIPIALALMLFYMYPAGVVVVDLALGRERMTPWRFLALALSSAGVVLVLFGGIGSGLSADPLGIALGIVAAAEPGGVHHREPPRLHGRAGRRRDAGDPRRLGDRRVGHRDPRRPGRRPAGPVRSRCSRGPYLLLAGVAAAGISSLLFLTAIRSIGGTRTGILMLLEPVVGVLLAALLLGEALTPAPGRRRRARPGRGPRPADALRRRARAGRGERCRPGDLGPRATYGPGRSGATGPVRLGYRKRRIGRSPANERYGWRTSWSGSTGLRVAWPWSPAPGAGSACASPRP